MPSADSISVSSTPYHSLPGNPPQDVGNMGERNVVYKKKGDWDKSDKKLGTCAAYALSGLKIFGAAVVKLLSLVLRLKIIRSPLATLSELAFGSNRQKLKDGYAKALSKSFDGRAAYVRTDLPENAGTPEEQKAFNDALDKFSKDLPKLKKDSAKMRARIVELSKDPVYLALAQSHPKHPAVRFVQDCGERLESANANDILFEYGRTRIAEHLPHVSEFKPYVRTDLPAVDGTTDQQRSTFNDALVEFSNKPPNPKIEQDILTLSELSKDPVYLALAQSHPKHAAVQFIQDCEAWFRPDLITHADLGKALKKGQKNSDSTRDGGVNSLLWGADHLTELFHVENAHLDPLGYDSYQNQMVFIGEPLVDGDHTIIHKSTPGLTGSQSIVENVLIPKYEEEGRRWIHIDNQSIHTADERQRIDQVHQWSVEHPKTLFHAVLSTDTPDKVNKALIKKFKKEEITKEKFVIDYEKALRGDGDKFIREYSECRGIHIPTELLDEKELEAAFTAARNMSLAAPDVSVDLVRRNILSTLSWAIMKKEQLRALGLGQPPSVFTENCKENVDRGPQENLDLLFNEDMAKGVDKIPREKAQVQAGINLGRADHAMDRPPQMKRLKPLTKRFDSFKSPAAFKRGHQELQSLRAVLAPQAVLAPHPQADAYADQLAES